MRHKNSRFIYMIIIGVVINFLLDFIMPSPVKVDNPLISIVITILVWEGNLRIDTWMQVFFPWEKQPAKRILLHLTISILYSAVMVYLSMLAFDKYVCDVHGNSGNILAKAAIIIGVLFSLMVLAIEAGIYFFGNLENTLLEVEKYKAESAQAQLQNLKNQVSPHFLFNNLSVLSSLVYKDQDKAVDFINQLSKVYRYLLDNRNNELVSVDEELAFVNSYNYLLKIRFDKNIVIDMEIKENYLSKLIPPMALQMLIENCVKHNEISGEQPLTIHVSVAENYLVVSNNLQLRSHEEPSSKTGLQNIKDRYKHFTNQEVIVSKEKGLFTVKIPLLVSR